MNSPYESWVPEAFGAISQSAEQSASYQYGLVSQFYRDLMSEMDSNRDGKVTAEEIRQALAVRDPLVKNVVNRLAVKHHSEWCKGRSTGRWEEFYKDLDPLEMKYCEKWQADLEWLSKVPPLDKDEAVWHFHPVVFLTSLKTEEDCAQLIWGEIVNQRLGAEKACEFRKKVVRICAEMWGEKNKVRYADILMGCMCVETNKMFTSSVVAYRKARHKNGEIIFISSKSRTRPKIELHVFTKDEITKDTTIVDKNAVGLIQFTSIAVQQINITHNLSVTKMQLALMDEVEQLDYVKLYFTSNKERFEQIKKPEDVYTYIFCPEGVGKPDDAVLYSKMENEKAYNSNSTLDSAEHGNKGNADGLIQKSELHARLNLLVREGEGYRNQCSCIARENNSPDWISVGLSEYNKYKGLIEIDPVLNDKIKLYHDTTNAKGKDGKTSWCSSFVNWCFTQTKYAPFATRDALAYSWGHGSWQNGEVVDKPFYGAIAVMKYSRVGFVCGINAQGRLLILGGNQGGGREGTANCISIRPNSITTVKYFMKPKGYNVRPEDYNLEIMNVSGADANYSDTH